MKVGSSGNSSVSLFFFTGDFAEAFRRFQAGEQQSYATHNEVVRLMHDLANDGFETTIYSYMTPEAKIEEPLQNVKIVSLGARSWDRHDILLDALQQDRSTALIPHFANRELIKACAAQNRNLMIGMASSYNRRNPKAAIERFKLKSVLSDPRIDLVMNHCLPSTEKLAQYGVPREKLVPWNVPLPFSPENFPAKQLREGRPLTMAYAGSISEPKGVGDIISAIAILKSRGIEVELRCAGKGNIDSMRNFAAGKGVGDLVQFLGVIGNRDVVQLFHQSDLVCVPSRHTFPEGFPLVMFEAIASRTPIICSDHPMFQPILGHGARAEMFKAENPRSLAKAVERAVESPEHYAALSRNADASWRALGGTADWRTLINEWVRNGPQSEWIQAHTLARMPREFAV